MNRMMTAELNRCHLEIRFFDETCIAIEECFISFTPILKLDAESITDCILNTPETLGLHDKSSLIGLCFDGASIIRCHLSDVQKRIRDKSPFPYFMHCCGHRLNLILINVTKHIPGVADFFSLLEKLYIFVSNPWKISWNITRNVFQQTSPRAATFQWYIMMLSGYIARKYSVAARSHHKILGADICQWNRSSCYIRGLLLQIDVESLHLLGVGGSDILGKIN